MRGASYFLQLKGMGLDQKLAFQPLKFLGIHFVFYFPASTIFQSSEASQHYTLGVRIVITC